MRALFILWLSALLLDASALAQPAKLPAPSPTPTLTAPPSTSAASPSASAPRGLCAYVYDSEFASARVASTTEPGCPTHSGTLTRVGDVVVVVTRKAWDQLVASAMQAGDRPRLFINGIAATDPTDLVSVEDQGDSMVHIRFHVGANKAARNLWTTLYRERNLTQAAPLRASLGWGSTPTILAPAPPEPPASAPLPPEIRITSSEWETGAFAVIAFMAIAFALGVAKTDLFRDGPPVNSRKATYSLARVQLGLWLFFLLAAAIFVFLVLGEPLAPGGSVVAMLGVSATTTAASVAVDRTATNRVLRPSEGFVSDLLTGWDGTKQLHRVQAVAVNLLLLVVGIVKVMEDLSYPVFDSGWLALLGISGASQAVLKQQLEDKPLRPTDGLNVPPLLPTSSGSASTSNASTWIPAGMNV